MISSFFPHLHSLLTPLSFEYVVMIVSSSGPGRARAVASGRFGTAAWPGMLPCQPCSLGSCRSFGNMHSPRRRCSPGWLACWSRRNWGTSGCFAPSRTGTRRRPSSPIRNLGSSGSLLWTTAPEFDRIEERKVRGRCSRRCRTLRPRAPAPTCGPSSTFCRRWA